MHPTNIYFRSRFSMCRNFIFGLVTDIKVRQVNYDVSSRRHVVLLLKSLAIRTHETGLLVAEVFET